MNPASLQVIILVCTMIASSYGQRWRKDDVVTSDPPEDIPEEYDVKVKEIDVPQHMVVKGKSVSVEKREDGEIVNSANIYHPTDNTVTQTVENMCVYAHNYLRNQHGVGNLTWNSTLASQAATYAKNLADTSTFAHSSGASSGQYGENLYMASNSYGAVSSVAHAVYSWYSESWRPNYSTVDKNYNYTFNPTDSATFYNAQIGHFTAVVWKDTTEVGCGVAKILDNGSTKTYVVAMYTSAGNVLGSFLTNVLPLTNGDTSLNGKLDVIDLVEGITDCGDFVSSSTCSSYSGWGYCSIVGENCDCAC